MRASIRTSGRRHLLVGLVAALLPGQGSATAPLRLGALRGPQAELLAYAAGLEPMRQLPIRLVVSDNAAVLADDLARGRLDGIASHNSQLLDGLNAAHGISLVAGFATVTLPTGIYSKRLHGVAQLGKGDRIVLPRPTQAYNRARVLLYNYGLLYAHEDHGLAEDFSNIVNPIGFVLETEELPALAGRLDDAAVVVLPYEAAVAAGLRPAVDSIGLEDGKSPYAQVLAVRTADRDRPWVSTLARSLQSAEMRRFIYDHFGDSIAPPW